MDIEKLRSDVAGLRQEAVARLAEIQKEIEALLDEGVTIADAAGVKFSLSSTSIAREYGMGGLRYIPEKAAEETYYSGSRSGWISSSSDEC